MTTNGKPQEPTELEAELLRLNKLVRERREQLARLEKCPNKDCPCRIVWRNHVEDNLAGQVGKIRRQVGRKTAHSAKQTGKAKPQAVTSRSRSGKLPRRRSQPTRAS
jgi:hypothetical protein